MRHALASAPASGRWPARVLACVLLVATGIGLTVPLRAAAAAEAGYSADAVKAAFLYRFTGYVGWPDEAGTDEPFTIAVLDAPAVAAALARLLPSQTVNGRRAVVREIDGPGQLGDARVLFVGARAATRLRDTARALAGRPVLVVAEQPDGLAAGASINFVLVEQRVRFEVSLPAAARHGIALRAGLLSVAHRVDGARPTSHDATVPGDRDARALYARAARGRTAARGG